MKKLLKRFSLQSTKIISIVGNRLAIVRLIVFFFAKIGNRRITLRIWLIIKILKKETHFLRCECLVFKNLAFRHERM